VAADWPRPSWATLRFVISRWPGAISLAHQIGYRGIEIWEKHPRSNGSSYEDDVAIALRERKLQADVVAPFLTFSRGPERLERIWKATRHALTVAGATRKLQVLHLYG